MEMPEEQATAFDSWSGLWQWLAPRLAKESPKRILILDELSYAAEADPAMLSALQQAWDQQFKDSNSILALCGSQVRTIIGGVPAYLEWLDPEQHLVENIRSECAYFSGRSSLHERL